MTELKPWTLADGRRMLYAPPVPDEEVRRFSEQIDTTARRLWRSLNLHKERYVRAWIAVTGLDPRDAVLTYWHAVDGKQCVRVEHRRENDLRHKLWELLEAGQCTAEAVRDALRLAEK